MGYSKRRSKIHSACSGEIVFQMFLERGFCSSGGSIVTGFFEWLGFALGFSARGVGIPFDLVPVWPQKRAEPCPPPNFTYKPQVERGRLL